MSIGASDGIAIVVADGQKHLTPRTIWVKEVSREARNHTEAGAKTRNQKGYGPRAA